VVVQGFSLSEHRGFYNATVSEVSTSFDFILFLNKSLYTIFAVVNPSDRLQKTVKWM
jgi:hypothetical protein